MTEYRVVIVVDRAFGARLAELVTSRYVRIVESPVNAPAIRKVWDVREASEGDDPLIAGVTSFAPEDPESAEAMCARVAELVAEHHGEYSHDPPWSHIEVIGAPLSARLRQVFESLGAAELQPTAEGFVCRRSTALGGAVGPRPARS